MSAGNLKPSVAISAEANLFSDPGLASMVTVKWLRSFWISCGEVDNRQTAFTETAQLTRSISFLLTGRKYRYKYVPQRAGQWRRERALHCQDGGV